MDGDGDLDADPGDGDNRTDREQRGECAEVRCVELASAEDRDHIGEHVDDETGGRDREPGPAQPGEARRAFPRSCFSGTFRGVVWAHSAPPDVAARSVSATLGSHRRASG